MTVIFKVVFIGLCVALINPLFKKNIPEFSPLVIIGGAVVILTVISGYLGKAFEKIFELAELSGIGGEYGTLIVKVTAIAYLCEYSASVVEDAGEKAAAKKIELAGKLVIFVMTFPLIRDLFEAVAGMI